jgi:uncharacterized protein (DUF362 family)
MKLTRRNFLAVSAIAGLGVIGGYFYIYSRKHKDPIIPNLNDGEVTPLTEASKVYVTETSDRAEGVRILLKEFKNIDFQNKRVVLKANYNSADPPPATTHPDIIEALVEYLKEGEASKITLAERSGMGGTNAVLDSMGVYDLGNSLGFDVISLDDLSADGWEKINADWLSWKDGFYMAKIFREADKVIQTCCLKTHRYGGHFTMSLKNSVGLIAKNVLGDRHNYMRELHRSSLQRVMIGEINAFYDVDLVVMDAVEAFVTGGPDTGDLVRPELMLASNDRVALDAVGVTILRKYGSTQDVMGGKVFELDQIKRAAEIGVGASTADDIALVPLNDGAVERVEEIWDLLLN